MTKWKEPIHNQCLIRLRNEGRTVEEIASEMGMAVRTISHWIKRLGLNGFKRGRKPGKRIKAERDAEICALARNGASIETLAVQYGLSQNRVYDIIKRERIGKEE